MSRQVSDRDLLRSYAERGDEAAFAQLVAAHVDLVYSAALRQVGNRQMAEDVTQAVFILLAKKARSLKPETILPAWLHRATRFTSLNAVKREKRRAYHERRAAEMSSYAMTSGASTQALAPMLDEGIARLNERERAAIILRFFERRSVAETGAALGISEEAAGMRISRALQKLRLFFRDRQLSLKPVEVGAVISVMAIRSAPAGLAASVTRTAMQAVHSGPSPEMASLVDDAAQSMVLEKLKNAVVVAMLCLAVTVATLAIGFMALQAWRQLDSPPPHHPPHAQAQISTIA
jgi:RNA polymerase sigma factor (sigma-70 family)